MAPLSARIHADGWLFTGGRRPADDQQFARRMEVDGNKSNCGTRQQAAELGYREEEEEKRRSRKCTTQAHRPDEAISFTLPVVSHAVRRMDAQDRSKDGAFELALEATAIAERGWSASPLAALRTYM